MYVNGLLHLCEVIRYVYVCATLYIPTRYGQRCFAVSGPTLEFHCLTDTDSVLCASEDCVVLQSMRNTSILST